MAPMLCVSYGPWLAITPTRSEANDSLLRAAAAKLGPRELGNSICKNTSQPFATLMRSLSPCKQCAAHLAIDVVDYKFVKLLSARHVQRRTTDYTTYQWQNWGVTLNVQSNSCYQCRKFYLLLGYCSSVRGEDKLVSHCVWRRRGSGWLCCENRNIQIFYTVSKQWNENKVIQSKNGINFNIFAKTVARWTHFFPPSMPFLYLVHWRNRHRRSQRQDNATSWTTYFPCQLVGLRCQSKSMIILCN